MGRVEGDGLVAIKLVKPKKKKKKRNRHTMWAKESRPHCRAEREGKASPGQRLLTLCEHQNYPENLLNIQGSDQQRRHVIQKTSLTNALELEAGDFLAVQWLELCASTAGGHGFKLWSGI